jgi:hypothetical protein
LKIYLNTCELSLKALNTLSNTGITTTYIILYNQKKKWISIQYFSWVKEFFSNNISNLLYLNLKILIKLI